MATQTKDVVVTVHSQTWEIPADELFNLLASHLGITLPDLEAGEDADGYALDMVGANGVQFGSLGNVGADAGSYFRLRTIDEESVSS